MLRDNINTRVRMYVLVQKYANGIIKRSYFTIYWPIFIIIIKDEKHNSVLNTLLVNYG